MLDTILKKSLAYQENYHKKEKILEGKINVLKSKLEKLNHSYKYWGTTFVKPLAKELQKHFPEYKHIEFLGPFGLRCDLSVFFYKRTRKQLDREFGKDEGYKKYYERENLISITFLPIDINKSVYEYETREEEKRYKTGSLGEVNGMNNISKPVETFEELINYLKKQIKK